MTFWPKIQETPGTFEMWMTEFSASWRPSAYETPRSVQEADYGREAQLNPRRTTDE